MKEMNDMNVEMYGVGMSSTIFVMVDYLDKYAEEHTGLMILDSGSQDSFLYPITADLLAESSHIKDETICVHTITDEVVKVGVVNFSFAMGGNLFKEKFCVSTENNCPYTSDVPIIGIIGNKFMQKHNLVIDYSTYTFHTSKVNTSNLSMSDYEFFFPMDIVSSDYYKLPLLSIRQNGNDVITLADTGASSNIIASQSLADNHFIYVRSLDKSTISGLASSSVQVEEVSIHFNLLTMKDGDLGELNHHADFFTLPYYICAPNEGDKDENGNEIPPIGAIVGSPFMSKQGWVLDFGAKIIYKLKKDVELEEAI